MGVAANPELPSMRSVKAFSIEADVMSLPSAGTATGSSAFDDKNFGAAFGALAFDVAEHKGTKRKVPKSTLSIMLYL